MSFPAGTSQPTDIRQDSRSPFVSQLHVRTTPRGGSGQVLRKATLPAPLQNQSPYQLYPMLTGRTTATRLTPPNIT